MEKFIGSWNYLTIVVYKNVSLTDVPSTPFKTVVRFLYFCRVKQQMFRNYILFRPTVKNGRNWRDGKNDGKGTNFCFQWDSFLQNVPYFKSIVAKAILCFVRKRFVRFWITPVSVLQILILKQNCFFPRLFSSRIFSKIKFFSDQNYVWTDWAMLNIFGLQNCHQSSKITRYTIKLMLGWGRGGKEKEPSGRLLHYFYISVCHFEISFQRCFH